MSDLEWNEWTTGRDSVPDDVPINEWLLVEYVLKRQGVNSVRYAATRFALSGDGRKHAGVDGAFHYDRTITRWCRIQSLLPVTNEE